MKKIGMLFYLAAVSTSCVATDWTNLKEVFETLVKDIEHVASNEEPGKEAQLVGRFKEDFNKIPPALQFKILEYGDEKGRALIHIATVNESIPLVEFLLTIHPKNLNLTSGNMKHTPLHLAILTNNVAMATYLVNKGANVNAKSAVIQKEEKKAGGNTPLHYAVDKENPELVSLLLKNGADISIQNFDHKTPFGYVDEKENKEIYNILATASTIKNLQALTSALATLDNKKGSDEVIG